MYYNDRDEYAEKHRKGPGWGYWHLWVLGISVAFAASRYMKDNLVDTMSLPSNMEAIGWVLSGTFRGLWIGFVQAAILWRFLDGNSRVKWWAVTIVAWAVGNFAVDIAQVVLGNVLYQWFYYAQDQVNVVLTTIGGALAGELVGLMQTPILRSRVQQAWRWRWSNLAAGAVSYVGYYVLQGLITRESFFIGACPGTENSTWNIDCAIPVSITHTDDLPIIAAMQGAIYAAITGFVLIDMLRHPRQQESAEYAPQVQP